MSRLRPRQLAPALVALVVLLVLGGCAGDDPLNRPSTVGVIASGCGLTSVFGGGAAVAPGVVVTTAHTLSGATTIEVDVGGERHIAELVVFDKNVDLALLAVPASLPVAPLGDLAIGDPATLETFHPDIGMTASTVDVRRRLLVTIEDIYVEGEYERRALELGALVHPGDSGSPVYNRRGELAGIVYATSRVREGTSFAVRSSEIPPLLDRVGEAVADASRCT